MQIAVCPDTNLIDLMRVPVMRETLLATSDQRNVAKVIPQTPGVWTPEASDIVPLLKVELPVAYGIRPDEYDVMSIDIKATYFVNVTVTVVTSDWQYPLSVSISVRVVRANKHLAFESK